MKLSKDQPFWTSVILHLVVLLGLFFAVLIESFKREEPEHVFEMVSPSSAPSQDRPTSSSSEPPPSLDLPDVVSMADLPDVAIPAPAPLPPKPKPKPTPSSTPAPKPPPEPSQPKLTSYEEFIKQNPIKEPRRPQPAPVRPTVSVPKISVPQLVVPRSSPSNSEPSLSAAQMSALGLYQSRIWSLINAAWIKPANLGGIQLTAIVVFEISSAGRISNVRLSPGSGNRTFDQSILAAFRQVGTVGPTPTGQSHHFKMPFKLD